uniref:Uncharacterized protein n=1 Tax=Timema bartmani TaxID=61472 RepID=A0A7R9EWJ7_9NEOP|nr:unnamed protein product [Timema bartmani]
MTNTPWGGYVGGSLGLKAAPSPSTPREKKSPLLHLPLCCVQCATGLRVGDYRTDHGLVFLQFVCAVLTVYLFPDDFLAGTAPDRKVSRSFCLFEMIVADGPVILLV